jgi:hypothetical protein
MRNGRKAATLALLALCAAAPRAAAEVEEREFTVAVGGKAAGKAVMRITRHEDGTETMAGTVRVVVKALIFTHKYEYTGSEQWQNGRLQHLRSSTLDGSTRFEVEAHAEAEALRVKVTTNGKAPKERKVRWDAWTGSHWKLADKRFFNQALPVVEVDSGKDFEGQLQYQGIAPVKLNGQPQNCHHFRLTGGQSPVDLWYDGSLRLVRQELTVDGHRLEIQLSGLKRE